MIYIFTALYCEAHAFIRHFHLEKNPKNTRFQEFYSETAGIRLVVTGIGEIAAAAAVGSVCAEYKPKEEDVLLNIGTCAHRSGTTGVFVCNKLTEQATGKTFYPDILYFHDFDEEAVVTGMQPWNREKDGAEAPLAFSDGNLYDMEAAAIYQAGSYYFGPHQMVFLKIVSDSGEAKEVSAKQVEQLMEACQDRLFDFVKQLPEILCQDAQKENCLWTEKEAMLEKLCLDMHCSKVMRDMLKQHIRYMELSGTDYVSVIQEMYREGLFPCKDKREGKLRFEELKGRLF